MTKATPNDIAILAGGLWVGGIMALFTVDSGLSTAMRMAMVTVLPAFLWISAAVMRRGQPEAAP